MKLLLFLLLVQDKASPVEEAAKKIAELQSYSFKFVSRNKESTGVFVKDDTLYVEGEKLTTYMTGGKKWVKSAGGEWKPARRTDDVRAPHAIAAKLAERAKKARKERSEKIGSVTVDVWTCNLEKEAAKEALEENGAIVRWFWAEFSPTQTGLMFYVGRSDGILHRVEQVYSKGETSRRDDDLKITLDFTDLGKAKLPGNLPE